MRHPPSIGRRSSRGFAQVRAPPPRSPLCRHAAGEYTWLVSEIEQQVVRALSAAVARLQATGIKPEALAEYVAPRRVLLVNRPATMRPIGEVWRLGTLLLGAPIDTPPEPSKTPQASPLTLWAAGHATRAAVRPHPNNQSVSREERRDIAAAALKGGYAEGTPVNYDAVQILLDEASLLALNTGSPLGFANGEAHVRWRAGASLHGAPTLQAYLDDRIGLLVQGSDPE